MIDYEIKFGAYVPTVPKVYEDVGLDDNKDGDHCSSFDAASECSIGKKWNALKLASIEHYNHDTSIFEFQLPDGKKGLNLPVMDHLLVRVPTTSKTNRSSANDVIGDNKDSNDAVAVRPYTIIDDKNSKSGHFKIMVKRYKEWGIPESKLKSINKVFLYCKTDHSYKPPGVVSTFIHSLKVGQYLDFKYIMPLCCGKVAYPFKKEITSITMISVGVGVAPMLRIIRALLDNDNDGQCSHVKTIRLLYGVRTVNDILQRKQLDEWHKLHSPRFKVCYCIGSRWTNIHFAAKTEHKTGPSLPQGWESVPANSKELGWVDGDKVRRLGASTPEDKGHRVFICGLPGVYMSLAGPRTDPKCSEGSQLYNLGFEDAQVIKF